MTGHRWPISSSKRKPCCRSILCILFWWQVPWLYLCL